MVLQQKVLGQVHLLSLRHHCIIWMVLLARHAFSDSQHAWGFVMGRLRSVKMGLKVCIRTLNFILWAWNCLETHFSVSESLDAWAHTQLYFSKVKWQAPTWQLFRRGRWRTKLPCNWFLFHVIFMPTFKLDKKIHIAIEWETVLGQNFHMVGALCR